MHYKVKIFPSPNDLAKESRNLVFKLATENVEEKGYFTLVLSGGKTPETLYENLAGEEIDKIIPWEYIFIFWGDERYVPKDHPESNYRMAYDYLLSKIGIPEKNIFPIPTEIKPLEKAARSYEKTLEIFFYTMGDKNKDKKPKFPSFDLILLGLGKDGHTASLYTGSPALLEKKRWVVPSTAPGIYTVKKRVTLTLPIINNAKNVLFLVSGEDKGNVQKAILNNEKVKEDYPASKVKPRGNLYWFTDIPINDI